MAYANVRAFQRAQAMIEGTRGTAEATMSRWLTVLQQGGAVATITQDREDAPETLRSFQSDRDTLLLSQSTRISIEARLSYEEIPWWYSMALKGGSATRTGTTTGSTPPGYTYTISPTDTADDLDTFTLKLGDTTVCDIFKRCAVNQMTLRCNPTQGGEATWRISLDIFAIYVGTGSFDSPSDITRTMVKSHGSKLYLDTASAIGTTELAALNRGMEVTVNNKLEDKMFVDGGITAHTDFGRGSQKVTGSFTLEHTVNTYRALAFADTAVKLRYEQTGAQIGTTPTTNYRTRVDIPQAKLNPPTETYIGNNKCMTYAWLAEKPVGASSIQTATVHAGATVVA